MREFRAEARKKAAKNLRRAADQDRSQPTEKRKGPSNIIREDKIVDRTGKSGIGPYNPQSGKQMDEPGQFSWRTVEEPKKIKKRKAPKKTKKKDTLDMTAKERARRAVEGLRKKQNRFSDAERRATLKKGRKRPQDKVSRGGAETTAFNKKKKDDY